MENASKALIIAGAILLSILIIAIGMFIYTSSQGTINDSMSQMSTQEIEGFNSQFTIYEGKQTGSKLKSLCGTLISNANTYAEEPGRLPTIIAHGVSSTDSSNNYTANQPAANGSLGEDGADIQNYINSVAVIRNKLENKHTFYVELGYSGRGILNKIDVYYTAPTASSSGGTTEPTT